MCVCVLIWGSHWVRIQPVYLYGRSPLKEWVNIKTKRETRRKKTSRSRRWVKACIKSFKKFLHAVFFCRSSTFRDWMFRDVCSGALWQTYAKAHTSPEQPPPACSYYQSDTPRSRDWIRESLFTTSAVNQKKQSLRELRNVIIIKQGVHTNSLI